MGYEIHVKQLGPELVLTKRLHTTLPELGKTMNATLSTMTASVDPPSATAGVPFAIYHNEPFRPDDIDVEMGLPLAREAKVTPDAGSPRHLPGGPVAYTIHCGSYRAIGAAYEALHEWLKAHGQTPSGPPREIYLVGPTQARSEAEYRTEIDVPIL